MSDSRGSEARWRSEAGMSLAELLVSVTVLAILMTIVSTFFIIGSKVTNRSDAVGQATGAISNAMNEISRVVRSGGQQPKVGESLPMPTVIDAGEESLTLYSNVDSKSTLVAPVIVQFAFDGQRNLVERRWQPLSSSGGYFTFPALTSSPDTMRVFPGPFLSKSTGKPATFTYVDADGNAMARPASGFTASQIRAISGVTVSIRLDRTRGNDAGSLELVNTVRFPNIGYAAS